MSDRRAFVALALVVAQSACATAATRRAAIVRAPLGTAESLYVDVLASADARRVDSVAFGRALASREGWLRGAAALAAGQTHAQAFAPTLRTLLRDADASVGARAAYALGQLHDTAGVDLLASALRASPIVGIEAAWALGEIGAPARAALARAIVDTALVDSTRVEVILAAGRLRPAPAMELRPLLASPSLAVRWAAAYSLTRSRQPAAVRAIIDAVRAETSARPAPQTARTYAGAASSAELRAFLARGLGKQVAGDSLAADARAALRTLASDRDAHVRINAVRSLATYGAAERDAVRRATSDSDANVRITAAESFGATGATDLAAWRDLWAADSGFTFRRGVLAGAAGEGVELPALRDWIAADDWRARAAVAEALAQPGADTLQPAANRALLMDRDGRVRSAAIGIFAVSADSGARSAASRASIVAMLGDPDPYVVAAAIGALTSRPRIAELRAVLAARRQLAADSALDARVATLGFVAAAWRADSAAAAADSAFLALASGPIPSTLIERAAVAPIAAFAAWRAAGTAPHDRAFYETIVRELVRPALIGHRPVATFRTERGPVRVELLPLDAPITVQNFIDLAARGTYDRGRFHRVVPNFVAQDGDPRGDGNGGVGHAIRDEFNPVRYTRGTLGMALSGPDTGGSQYFLTLSSQPHLDGHYTVFGRALDGWGALDALVQGDRLDAVVIAR